jgi:hypothetical protein
MQTVVGLDPQVADALRSRLAEVAVARAVEQLEVESLVDDLEALETRWPAQVTRLLPLGTEATALSVTQVEARLTGGAA